ncbi:MAG: metal-binding protein [Fulvimarina sp.]|nr:metal-binding protein [Fulvimarina sp.]
MDGEPVSPLRVLLPAGPLPQDGRRIAFKATPEDCARLAAALQVDRLTAMGANLMARPFRKDGARVTGRFSAVVVQKSVVTLEPVEQRIDEPFEATFLREARAPRRQAEAEPTEIVIDPEAEDPPEPFVGDRIDLGPRLYEALALVVDPYPKRPGERFGAAIEPEAETEEPPSPFAVLANFRDGRGGPGGDGD